jgi:hypothetical protein
MDITLFLPVIGHQMKEFCIGITQPHPCDYRFLFGSTFLDSYQAQNPSFE